jgi:hypothetical protein
MLKEALIRFGPTLLHYAVAGLTVFIAPKVIAWASAKAAAAKVGSAAQKEFALLAALTRCAADAVAAVESQLRPEADTDAADGKLTPEEAARLKRTATDLAIAQAKACFPELLKLFSDVVLGARLDPVIEGQAALLAGDSRAKLASTSVPSRPAAA